MLTKLNYVTLFVEDQDRALDFYTTALGFEKRVDTPSPGGRFVGVGLEGQEELVILWPGTPGRAKQGPGPDPGTIIIVTNDCRGDFERLRSRGVTFAESEPVEAPYGVHVTAVDPDGNRIRLNQRPADPAAQLLPRGLA
jgi:catechol 2,3-dioxygenase-like lactoylglutathione lyase family enzyme